MPYTENFVSNMTYPKAELLRKNSYDMIWLKLTMTKRNFTAKTDARNYFNEVISKLKIGVRYWAGRVNISRCVYEIITSKTI
jgi:hypothetical protein